VQGLDFKISNIRKLLQVREFPFQDGRYDLFFQGSTGELLGPSPERHLFQTVDCGFSATFTVKIAILPQEFCELTDVF
jgi:hypothetical protein